MAQSESVNGFGRFAGPATLLLSSLAEGPKHGWALTKDIEARLMVAAAPTNSPPPVRLLCRSILCARSVSSRSGFRG
jgi:hypothetical protein